jgi:CheY-like chemotaxis protein
MVRLAQAISNLLTNAAKYSKTPLPIELGLRREGEEAVVTVKDCGVGIPPELLPRIFDLFVQGEHALARSQGGLGIGLTLVQRLIEMHGGTVSASSGGVGRGTEFRIHLPCLPESSTAGHIDAAPERAARDGPMRRVLVVDDNVDAADSIGKILAAFGHQVRCEYDGPCALAAARDYRPEVVLLDIGLPGMDGYEVARKLREIDELKGVLIIAVTGYGQEEDRRRSRASGFNEHLTKPVDPETLQTFVATG